MTTLLMIADDFFPSTVLLFVGVLTPFIVFLYGFAI